MITEKQTKVSLRSLDVKFNVFDGRLDALEEKIHVLDSKFEEKFDGLSEAWVSFEASQRKMGVLMETMDGKLSLMLEGYVGHDARIVRLENAVERLEGKN